MTMPLRVFEPGPNPSSPSGLAERELWRAHFQARPLEGIPAEEVEAHFLHMPESYWANRSEEGLVWALEVIHRFLVQAVGNPNPEPCPVVDWRHDPDRGLTRVLVCEWDRPGLLAQVAAAFSALRLNVNRADVFTRSDQIALDMFEVREMDLAKAASGDKLGELSLFIASALKEPMGYIISRLSEPAEDPFRRPGSAPQVRILPSSDPGTSLLEVESLDRLGLLYDILQGLAGLEVRIVRAIIDTDGEVARDLLWFTDGEGCPVNDPVRLRAIEKAVRERCLRGISGEGTHLGKL